MIVNHCLLLHLFSKCTDLLMVHSCYSIKLSLVLFTILIYHELRRRHDLVNIFLWVLQIFIKFVHFSLHLVDPLSKLVDVVLEYGIEASWLLKDAILYQMRCGLIGDSLVLYESVDEPFGAARWRCKSVYLIYWYVINSVKQSLLPNGVTRLCPTLPVCIALPQVLI